MSDDLVKRLREGTNGTDVTKTDEVLTAYMREAADRIEALEAKLAMAVELALEECPFVHGSGSYHDWWHKHRAALAKIKGQSDD